MLSYGSWFLAWADRSDLPHQVSIRFQSSPSTGGHASPYMSMRASTYKVSWSKSKASRPGPCIAVPSSLCHPVQILMGRPCDPEPEVKSLVLKPNGSTHRNLVLNSVAVCGFLCVARAAMPESCNSRATRPPPPP